MLAVGEDPLVGLTLIVSLLTLLVAIAALGIARGQLKNIETTGRAESLKLILAPLDDPEIRQTRYLVLRDDWPPKLPLPDAFNEVADIDRRVRQLGYAYDTLAIFVLKELIPAEFVFEIHGESVVLVWRKLRDFVLNERRRRPNYAHYWEILANRWDLRFSDGS